jgi:hypothetical protein
VLRINGSYLLGDYEHHRRGGRPFALVIAGCRHQFCRSLALTDAQLHTVLNQSARTDKDGAFAAGFSMLLDTSVEYYYLKRPRRDCQQALAEGQQPVLTSKATPDFFHLLGSPKALWTARPLAGRDVGHHQW